MAEEFVTYDKYRADLADFRADMSRYREETRSDIQEIRGEIKDLRIELHQAIASQTKWLAGLVIVVAGVALAAAKLF